MEKGKIIVIEGTDCSGKETQSKLLIKNLNSVGMETEYFGFPNYSSPTGRIVGLPYLGKSYIAKELIDNKMTNIEDKIKELFYKYRGIVNDTTFHKIVESTIEMIKDSLGSGWFPEGATQVDPKISSLYYAADRAYNISTINDFIKEGKNVILDRYIYSNLAHQGGKIKDDNLRKEMYDWNCNLEFKMMGLPESDIKLFLHMPTDYATFLRKSRSEALDEHERDFEHLYNAEKAYIEIAQMFNFDTIKCIRDNAKRNICPEDIKTKEEISEEVFNVVKKHLHL